jgi:hypothetical protein
MVLGMSVAVVLSGVAGASGANAQPFPPGTLCNFTLSPPEVVQVSGNPMVSATMTPAGCAGAFRPYVSVACLQLQGEPNQCTQARGGDAATVLTAYRPGATYLSSGRGMGTLFNDMSEPNWQLLGPISATL